MPSLHKSPVIAAQGDMTLEFTDWSVCVFYNLQADIEVALLDGGACR